MIKKIRAWFASTWQEWKDTPCHMDRIGEFEYSDTHQLEDFVVYMSKSK